MARLNARDGALVVVSVSVGAAIALITRLPARPDENNLLGLIGSLLGAAIAVVASLFVLARQFETADERHLRTIKLLIERLRDAGVAMAADEAALDPVRYVREGLGAYLACEAVAEDLRANGPAIARVAELLRNARVRRELNRLSDAQDGAAAPDVTGRGNEVIALADDLSARLHSGL